MYFGLAIVPRFKWSSSLQTLGWSPIQQVNCSCHCLSPKLTWDTLAFQQASGHLHHGSVSSLNDTILLWCIGSCCEVLHSTLITVLLEFYGVKLSSPVTSECSEFAFSFSFSQCLNLLETSKCLIFHCQKLNPHVTRVIINYEQKVVLATSCTRLDLAT